MKDSQFMSAKEKTIVLKQWKNFLRHVKACDFNEKTGSDYGYFPTTLNKPFTKKLYQHLSGSFGFIAHYNRLGFLAERFGSQSAVEETLQQMRDQPTYHSDYQDINAALLESAAPSGSPENVFLAL